MKPHFIVKLKPGTEQVSAPYWGDFIENKSKPIESLNKNFDEICKKYKTDFWVTREYKSTSERNGLEPIDWTREEIESGLNRIYRIILQDDKDIPDGLIEEVNLIPIVERVTPGRVGVAHLPKESFTMAQETFTNKPAEQIFLDEAKLWSKGNAGIKIAVLDTGVDLTHPEFAHTLLPGMDFVDIIDGADQFIGDYLGEDTEPMDEVGHGSHVTGILCAKGRSMPEGVVPSCKVIPVRVLGAMNSDGHLVGAGLIDNISAGIKWAVDAGADIINMSLGVKHTGGGLPHKEVIAYAISKGVSVVAASGNDGTNDKYYPGALDNVIAVGAVDYDNNITGFSTFGPHLSLVAPGFKVYSASLNHGYAYASGTSQASPFVAGSIALLKSYALKRNHKLSDKQVKYVLKMTADRNFNGMKDIKYGYGKINLLDAVKFLDYKFLNN